MDVDNLIEMANRIGEFFDSMPDHEEAVDGVADHIHRFWEPRMRLAILGALDNESCRLNLQSVFPIFTLGCLPFGFGILRAEP